MSGCKQRRSMQGSVKTLSIWGDLSGKDPDDTEVRIQGDEPAQMQYMFEHPMNAWLVRKPWGGGGCMVSDLGLGAWNSWYRRWACIRSIWVREYYLCQRGHYCLKTLEVLFHFFVIFIFLLPSIRLHRIWNIGYGKRIISSTWYSGSGWWVSHIQNMFSRH
jgi:hypothetical protein